MSDQTPDEPQGIVVYLDPAIPFRTERQDEVILAIVARRTDPANPNGDALPDLGQILDGPAAAPLASGIIANLEAIGFDPAQSYITMASLHDAERGAAVTLADLKTIIANGDFGQDPAPSDPDPEVPTEPEVPSDPEPEIPSEPVTEPEAPSGEGEPESEDAPAMPTGATDDGTSEPEVSDPDPDPDPVDDGGDPPADPPAPTEPGVGP